MTPIPKSEDDKDWTKANTGISKVKSQTLKLSILARSRYCSSAVAELLKVGPPACGGMNLQGRDLNGVDLLLA